jgi:hypothetical protein
VFQFAEDGFEVRVDLIEGRATDGLGEWIGVMDDLVDLLNAAKDRVDSGIIALICAVCPNHADRVGRSAIQHIFDSGVITSNP